MNKGKAALAFFIIILSIVEFSYTATLSLELWKDSFPSNLYFNLVPFMAISSLLFFTIGVYLLHQAEQTKS